MKKVKHDTSLNISLGYFGFGDETIYVNIENDDMDNIEVGLYQEYESVEADPILAIDDAISTLKVMINRLEKLKKVKDPMKITSQDNVNRINDYLE